MQSSVDESVSLYKFTFLVGMEWLHHSILASSVILLLRPRNGK